MLTYASIRSTVMQVEMASPAAMASLCGGKAGAMSGMGPARDWTPPSAPGVKHGGVHSTACPYCAVAGHLPILGDATPLRVPTAFVFTAFRVVAGHGPRGPPTLQPRARGPPTDPLTL